MGELMVNENTGLDIDAKEETKEEIGAVQSKGESDQETKKRRKKSKGTRPFPVNAIEEAICIAKAIREFNGGNPWSPDDIAKAIEMGKGNNLYYLTASSRDYGFTEGTLRADKISLASVGRNIVYARSPDEEVKAYTEAFNRIPLFKSVYEYYQGRELPQIDYLRNTLVTEFSLDEEFHDEFYEIYQKNIKFITSQKSTKYELIDSAPTKEQNHSNDSLVLGEPERKTNLVAFVAMPFSEKSGEYPTGFFDEVLSQVITPAAIKAGFKAETAKKKGSDVIQSTIINDLSNADLVVVDLTEHNPNVLFELGWRMALDKPIVLIRAIGTKPIFDVDHMLRVYDYDPRLWKSTVEKDVPNMAEHIKASWDSRDSEQTYFKLLKTK